jgi:hypothetical protein
MGFVSEQGSLWKDQVRRCERREFVDVFPGRFWKSEYRKITDGWPVQWVRSACGATRFLRLGGTEFVERTIWSRTGSTITIWDGWGRMNFGQ